jgi:Holliday junction DNA helicase RuvA
MIASLDGDVLEISSDSLVVGLGGLGLRVYVPAPLRDRVQVGDRIHLETQLIVRQDSMTLYGFETTEIRDFYTLLLGVDGIGPRSALSVLSVLSVDAIRRAVFSEQADVFSRVPGIGRKTAQKILLHLQGRIGREDELAPVARMTDVETEVLGALTTLGYSIVEAQAALQSIPRDTPQDVETRLRMALQYFST